MLILIAIILLKLEKSDILNGCLMIRLYDILENMKNLKDVYLNMLILLYSIIIIVLI